MSKKLFSTNNSRMGFFDFGGSKICLKNGTLNYSYKTFWMRFSALRDSSKEKLPKFETIVSHLIKIENHQCLLKIPPYILQTTQQRNPLVLTALHLLPSHLFLPFTSFCS
ncbi:hypothetical protein Ferpe_0146 [Fervidobacterium pennivorans DSM 9078]|uniref:Uncharacterized protein n=1 Tax=Fervidobacterium pennivorans (strain DSM 9078 / Ven5) TaxID=771875 RepID=H9U9V6_FERPD|nr:hypothetical protein Ferpe_0146 [Fervidobacterium pennivorans DSM 9078]